jgi:hypothetical protein
MGFSSNSLCIVIFASLASFQHAAWVLFATIQRLQSADMSSWTLSEGTS